MNRRRKLLLAALFLLLLTTYFLYGPITDAFAPHQIGQPIDSLNGVKVYYNGDVGHVSDRNVSADGYNIGMKYQCVEFVKRYYYEHLNHKMPDSYGNAKDFFDKNIADGQLNPKRNLLQFTNPGNSKPQVNDLLVFSATLFNRYGHVAIVSKVSETEIEIIQQNPGKFKPSRKTIPLGRQSGQWKIGESRILGWLRKA
jgi:surface antigen